MTAPASPASPATPAAPASHPHDGGRYYLVDGVHVPEAEYEARTAAAADTAADPRRLPRKGAPDATAATPNTATEATP